MWHASIALVRNCKGPKKAAAWSAREKAEAWAIAADLLRGVGEGPNHAAEGEVAVHLRRRLSAAELALLDPAWLALPAVDGE